MNHQIRHRSPKAQNNLFNNFYQKSPDKKDINIIKFNNNIVSKLNNAIYNTQFNYSYNNSSYNCYEEITKAFNFITSILKQKDNQIKDLKMKIKQLERQLNDINETNIMTFNNKDISEIYSGDEKHDTYNIKENNLKRITYKCIPNNMNICYSTSNSKSKNNNENNILTQKNNELINSRIKNSTNINKINNYRNKIDLNGYRINNNNINNTNNFINFNKQLITEENNHKLDMNSNINEYSKEKKDIIVRKEPYHSNMNIKFRNVSGKTFRNIQTNETDTSTGNDKIKIYNMSYRANSKNSKSNSFTLSDEGLVQSKNEIKKYLREIKDKMEHNKFKKFVELIKTLIKNKNSGQKNAIISEIKSILVDKNLINKFENILKIK